MKREVLLVEPHNAVPESELFLFLSEKGMWFQCEQLFLSGKCVTSRKTTVKETICHLDKMA